MTNRTLKDETTSFSFNQTAGLMAAMGAGLFITGPVDADTTFTNIAFFPSVNDVYSVPREELTGDGLIDFATLEQFGKVMTFQSLGFGRFAIENKVEGNGQLREHLRIGDFDSNGTPDYLWSQSNIIYIYHTKPDGNLLDLQTVTDSDEPLDIEIGDFNQDGDLDFVSLSTSEARVYLNRGRELNFGFIDIDHLSPADPDAADMVVGDIDFDGDLDITILSTDYYNSFYYGIKVYDSHVSVFLNNGLGKFDTVTHFRLPYGQNGVNDHLFPQRLAMGDLDNDGDQDFVVTAENVYDNYDSEALIVENLGNSTIFQSGIPMVFDAGSYRDHDFLPIKVADLDLDGDLDIVLSKGSSIGTFMTFLGNGSDLNFVQGASGDSPVGLINDIQIDDFDQDGFPDLLLGGDKGTVVLSNNADRYYGPFLHVDPIIKDKLTTLWVNSAQPDKEVFWLYRRGLPVEEVPVAELGGLILEVGSQFSVAGSATVDDNGTAILNIPVPNDAPSDMITIQAVVQGDPDGTNSRKTNFHTTRIQP